MQANTNISKRTAAGTFEQVRVLVALGADGETGFDKVSLAFEVALFSGNRTLWHIAMFEIIELGKKQPQLVVQFIKKILLRYYPYSLHYEPIRVLVELGHSYPHQVLSVLEDVLSSNDEHLTIIAVYELTKLSQAHPAIFIPLLGKIFLTHDNPHVQWIAALSITTLAKTHSQHVAPILQQIFANKDAKKILKESKKCAAQSNIAMLRKRRSLEKYKKIFQEDNEDKQWKAIFEIIDFAHINFVAAMPILELALTCQNPHVQWVANLTVLHLGQSHQEGREERAKNASAGNDVESSNDNREQTALDKYLRLMIERHSESPTLSNNFKQWSLSPIGKDSDHSADASNAIDTGGTNDIKEMHKVMLESCYRNSCDTDKESRIIPQLPKKLHFLLPKIFPHILQSANLDLQIAAFYEVFNMLEKDSLEEQQIIGILEKIFCHQNFVESIRDMRLLPELAKSNFDLALSLLQEGMKKNDIYLKKAVKNELSFLQQHRANSSVVASRSLFLSSLFEKDDCAEGPSSKDAYNKHDGTTSSCEKILLKRQYFSNW